MASPLSAQDIDPLTARVERNDLERFVTLWQETDGHPTAAQLQARYLQPGSRAIEVFTPGRIVDAAHLAEVITTKRGAYQKAIDRCYPWLDGSDAELRAVYLALHGLLPDRPLPEIAVVFGADNSGGTAAPGIQVLGLEVLCRDDPDEQQFRAKLRGFFAHETVHTLQAQSDGAFAADPLLTSALLEGGADYIASIVTGKIPDATRDAWAAQRQDWIFSQFAADRALILDRSVDKAVREAAFRRWFANAGSPPEGWPGELGYWVGMRIAQGYVEQASDSRAAIRHLLDFDDSQAILSASGVALVLPQG